jgi:hypothetical protein
VHTDALCLGILQNIFFLLFKQNGRIHGQDKLNNSSMLPMPGCFYTSAVADWGNFHGKLDFASEGMGLKYVIDSTFCNVNSPFLINLSKDDLTADEGMMALVKQIKDITKKGEATYKQQLAGYACSTVICPDIEKYIAL